MKAIVLILIFPFSLFSQGEYNNQIGFHGIIDIPIKQYMPKMSWNWGIGLQYAYRPFPNFPMFIEAKGNWGLYSSHTSRETFIFEDGMQTTTDVTYTSKMNRLTFGTKFYLSNFYAPVRVYATPQVGVAFMKSKISIADPEDTDGCMPRDNKIVQRDNGFYYGGEVGLDLDIRKIFTGNDSQNSRMYVSVSYLNSAKNVEYINTKYMEDHHHGMEPGNSETEETTEDRPLTTEFINLGTNEIHEHKIAELYRTPLKFISINIGYIWYF